MKQPVIEHWETEVPPPSSAPEAQSLSDSARWLGRLGWFIGTALAVTFGSLICTAIAFAFLWSMANGGQDIGMSALLLPVQGIITVPVGFLVAAGLSLASARRRQIILPNRQVRSAWLGVAALFVAALAVVGVYQYRLNLIDVQPQVEEFSAMPELEEEIPFDDASIVPEPVEPVEPTELVKPVEPVEVAQAEPQVDLAVEAMELTDPANDWSAPRPDLRPTQLGPCASQPSTMWAEDLDRRKSPADGLAWWLSAQDALVDAGWDVISFRQTFSAGEDRAQRELWVLWAVKDDHGLEVKGWLHGLGEPVWILDRAVHQGPCIADGGTSLSAGLSWYNEPTSQPATNQLPDFMTS